MLKLKANLTYNFASYKLIKHMDIRQLTYLDRFMSFLVTQICLNVYKLQKN